MKTSRIAIALGTAVILAGAVTTAHAQLGDLTAAQEGFDTLQGGSTGPDPSAVNRARETVNQAGGFQPPPPPAAGGGFQPPPPAAGGGFQPPPAGGGGFQAPPATGGFTPPGGDSFGGFGGVAQAAAANVQLTAIGGIRISSRVSGQILHDARAFKIGANMKDSYYDDGQTGGDARAGDEVFTNITFDDSYISPEEFRVKSKVLNALNALEYLAPQDFFQVRVSTDELISTLPKNRDLEESRDQRLEDWADKFLRSYRVNPESVTSPFIRAFIPLPPKAPDQTPLPATFSPRRTNAAPEQAEGEGESGFLGGRTLDDPVTGEPVGAASSRYF